MALRFTQSPIQWAQNFPPKVKNKWICISFTATCLHDVDRDNLTFYLHLYIYI